ncbi:MAG: hypothetical protein OYL92_13830 [Acidobacteriota bacterium]|nr:hypothetical protein [Acidobacteriota bacterium]MDE3266039.1 hypothetical protein [Acidobacteriota bacterium]
MNRRAPRPLLLTAVAVLVCTAPPLVAEGSPWLPAPGSGTVTFSYVSQEATDYERSERWRSMAGADSTTIQLAGTLGLDTVWINGTYGISDALALDFQIGTSDSQYPGGGPKHPNKDDLSGLQDARAGLTWRFRDEVVTSGPSMALRFGAILAGDYDTGYINSLGDGGNGAEVSLLIGKYVGQRGVLSAEVGYRYRTDDIPEDIILNLSAGVLVGERVGLSVGYRMTDGGSGLDIGVPPFSPARFPELQEDIDLLYGTVNIGLTGSTSLALTYGDVIGGRNTPNSEVIGLSVGFTFGGGGF